MRRLNLVILLASLMCAPLAWAQELSSSVDDAAAENDPKMERLSKLFSEKAESLEMVPVSSDVKYKLVTTPLFSFATEGTVFGSVYVWHDADERLAAIGTIGSLPINGTDMQFVELNLLKPVPIVPLLLKGYPDKQWSPSVDELKLREIASAPSVASNDRMRMTQMRSLAREFHAEMVEGEQTNQLRLLPQPIYRYSASTQQRDGALFAFVWDRGTDPELVLRIEAIENAGQVSWHFQPIRFTWRALKLSHRDVAVFASDEFIARDLPTQSTPYITGLTEVIP